MAAFSNVGGGPAACLDSPRSRSAGQTGSLTYFLLAVSVLSLFPPALLSHLDAPRPVPADLRHTASCNVVTRILHQDAPARHHPPGRLQTLDKNSLGGYT